jgi:hypothetical protein
MLRFATEHPGPRPPEHYVAWMALFARQTCGLAPVAPVLSGEHSVGAERRRAGRARSVGHPLPDARHLW